MKARPSRSRRPLSTAAAPRPESTPSQQPDSRRAPRRPYHPPQRQPADPMFLYGSRPDLHWSADCSRALLAAAAASTGGAAGASSGHQLEQLTEQQQLEVREQLALLLHHQRLQHQLISAEIRKSQELDDEDADEDEDAASDLLEPPVRGHIFSLQRSAHLDRDADDQDSLNESSTQVDDQDLVDEMEAEQETALNLSTGKRSGEAQENEQKQAAQGKSLPDQFRIDFSLNNNDNDTTTTTTNNDEEFTHSDDPHTQRCPRHNQSFTDPSTETGDGRCLAEPRPSPLSSLLSGELSLSQLNQHLMNSNHLHSSNLHNGHQAQLSNNQQQLSSRQQVRQISRTGSGSVGTGGGGPLHSLNGSSASSTASSYSPPAHQNHHNTSSSSSSSSSSTSSYFGSSGWSSAADSLASCSPERAGCLSSPLSSAASLLASRAQQQHLQDQDLHLQQQLLLNTNTTNPNAQHLRQSPLHMHRALFLNHHHRHNHHNHDPHDHSNSNHHHHHHPHHELGPVHKADSEDLCRIRSFIELFKSRRGALGLTQKQAAQCFRAYTNDRYAFSDNFVGHFEGFQFRPQTAMTIADSLAEWLEYAENETRQGRQLSFMPGKVKETRKRKYEVIRIRDSAKRVLVEAFEKNRSPSTSELEALSKKTNIPSRNIEIFFKNRRTSRQYHQ